MSDHLEALKKRYADCQRTETDLWSRSEEAQARFFAAERRDLVLNDPHYGEEATAATRAWSAAHAETIAVAAAMLETARAEAVSQGWATDWSSDDV